MNFLEKLIPSRWIRNFCVNILKCGPIPQHVAIIIDGNRRYAKQHKLPLKDVYKMGRNKLQECCSWCMDLGIPEISFYVFSIDNFQRTEEEVCAVMNLLLEYSIKSFRGEVSRFQVIGNIGLLSEEVQKAIKELVYKNRSNAGPIVNLAIAYASRDEVTRLVAKIAKGVKSKLIEIEDIDEQLLDSCIYSTGCSKVDLCIRTSGETRLSDFLLWQIKVAKIHFEAKLWPEFGFWDFLKVVFLYQRSASYLERIEESISVSKHHCERVQMFLGKLKEESLKTP